jgi:hypothetical protein
MSEEAQLTDTEDLQERLAEVQTLLARHKLVEELVHRQEGPRHDLVEDIVHKQHLHELQHRLDRCTRPTSPTCAGGTAARRTSDGLGSGQGRPRRRHPARSLGCRPRIPDRVDGAGPNWSPPPKRSTPTNWPTWHPTCRRTSSTTFSAVTVGRRARAVARRDVLPRGFGRRDHGLRHGHGARGCVSWKRCCATCAASTNCPIIPTSCSWSIATSVLKGVLPLNVLLVNEV